MSKLKEIIHQYVVEALEEILSEGEAPTYDVVHPKHGIIGTHNAQTGFKPSKPHLGYKSGKTVPNGASIKRPNSDTVEIKPKAKQISEMNYQDDKWKLVKTYPAQSENHATAKVYKNITGKHWRNNEDYHIQVIKNGKVHEPGEGFADDEEDAHMQAKRISGHPVKKEVEEGYKREMRLVRALNKNPSNEKLKSQTNSAFNRGIERSLRSIRKRNSERVQKASQSDPHDQDF